MSEVEWSLKGRTALVTGATRGLGLEIARTYVRAGADLFLCARDHAQLKAAAEMLKGENPSAQIEFASGDIGSKDDVDRIVGAAVERFPELDILVNNAGGYGPMGLLEEIDWEEWKRAITVNLYGSALTVRNLLPHLKARCYGKIIQLSGGGATNPVPRITAYAASKAAIVRLIESVAEECRPYGIDANSIAPGPLNTRMLDEVLSAGPDKVGQDFFARSLKQKESGGVDSAYGARLALFLASHASDGITGKLISALWDRYEEWPARKEELRQSDAYSLRRIVGRDRGMKWGDR